MKYLNITISVSDISGILDCFTSCKDWMLCVKSQNNILITLNNNFHEFLPEFQTTEKFLQYNNQVGKIMKNTIPSYLITKL